MSYEIFSRHQRAKTALVNKGLLSSLIFCVCVWLLCLLRHSNISRNQYGGSTETHLYGGNVYVYVGRKELGAWSAGKDEGIGSVFSGNQKTKARAASFHDENGYVLEKYRNHEVGFLNLKGFTKRRDKNLNLENNEQVHLNSEAAEPDEKVEGNDHDMSTLKYSEQLDNQQIIMKNGEASDQKNYEELGIIQKSIMDSSTHFDLNETEHEFLSFHDENGIQDISGWPTYLGDAEVEEESTSHF